MAKHPELKDAYALSTPEEVVDLYQNWARSYDAGFGDAQGYQLPQAVAQAFVAAGGKGPVLDVGAGTGLVAECLKRFGINDIDGVDLSDDMLAVAREKQLYQATFVGDVTKPLGSSFRQYAGIVSAGTFTHGHVGPEGLDALLGVAQSGAIFALSVNASHFERLGFEAKFTLLEPDLTNLSFTDVRIYDDRADADHRDDVARIVTFEVR